MDQFADVLVCRIGPDDWAILAELRLLAIAESPAAFLLGAAESERDEVAWRGQFSDRVWFDASIDGCAVGLASTVVDEDHRYVESMWVAPGYRRRGIATELLRRIEQVARVEGRRELRLYVLEGNEQAERIYTRLGFHPTGRGGQVGVVRRCQEREFKRPLGAPAVSAPESVGR